MFNAVARSTQEIHAPCFSRLISGSSLLPITRNVQSLDSTRAFFLHSPLTLFISCAPSPLRLHVPADHARSFNDCRFPTAIGGFLFARRPSHYSGRKLKTYNVKMEGKSDFTTIILSMYIYTVHVLLCAYPYGRMGGWMDMCVPSA